MRKISIISLSVSLLTFVSQAAAEVYKVDVVVFGGTSGGIVAAVQAARMGKTVQLIEPSTHVGGMTSGGLEWIYGPQAFVEQRLITGLNFFLYVR